MGHRGLQEDMAQKELNIAEYLRIRPMGYDTVIRHVDHVKRHIKDLGVMETRARVVRQELEAFIRPYLCYEEALNNALIHSNMEVKTK